MCDAVLKALHLGKARMPTFGLALPDLWTLVILRNAWNRALNTLQREAHEERSFISNVARTGMKWYENAAKAEMNFYKNAAKAEMNAYKSAAKWAGLW